MTPATIIERLDKIVGLYPGGNPAGQSGYTLTDQKDGLPLKVLDGVAGCPDGVATILAAARTGGSRNFLTDFVAEFSEYFDPLHADYAATLGKLDASAAITDGRPKCVLQIQSYGVDASLAVSAVQMYSSVAANVVVSVYSENDLAAPITTFTVPCAANKWERYELPSAIVLYLSDTATPATDGRPRFFFVWDTPAGSFPRSNAFSCCGQNRGYQGFFEPSGYTITSLSEMATPITAKSHGGVGMGMALECYAACSFAGAFAHLEYAIYSASGWQWVLAKTLQHGGVVNLADTFIRSQNINQYTLLSREAVYGTRSHADAEYRKGIKWLVRNMPGGVLNCFTCRPTVYRVGEILV